MKKINWMIAFMVLVSCGSQKMTPLNQENKSLFAEHIWELQSLGDRNISEEGISNGKNLPFIEFRLADKQVMGNDGCNQIMASIEQLGDDELKLGPIMGTKMACMDMELPDLFHAAMANIRSYKLTHEKDKSDLLHLYDSHQQEILVFILKAESIPKS